MRYCIIIIAIFCSCNSRADKSNRNILEIQFDILDKNANELEVVLKLDYSIPMEVEKRLEHELGKSYIETFIKPTLKSNTRNLLIQYSAGDIYNYKRPEIRVKMDSLVNLAFNKMDIKIENVSLISIIIPEPLLNKLLQEHIDGMNKADDIGTN